MKTPFANIGERRAVPSNAPPLRAVDFRRFERADYSVCAVRAEYPGFSKPSQRRAASS